MSLHFIKLDLADWADGTCEMTLAQEGAYLRICAALYRAGGSLPDDDARIAKRLRLDVRSWRHHRRYLIEEGKIVAQDGQLSQPRVTNELADIDARSSRDRRKIKPTSEQHRTDFEPTSTELRSDLPKKANENNGKFRQIETEKKKENIPPPSPPADARGDCDKPSVRDWFPDPYAAESGVQFADGRVTLVNGTRQFWLEQFGGDDRELDLALISVAGQVRLNDRRTIATQVQTQLARNAQLRRERDNRYRRNAAKRSDQSTRSNPSVRALAILDERDAADNRRSTQCPEYASYSSAHSRPC